MKTHWQILVVDDEEGMCESLAAWLREDGYTVDTACSGHEAVGKARQRDYAIYFVDLKMPGGMVMLQVADNGEGIAPENLSKIFDPFFTTKSEGKGVGLGLAVSYGIIEAHGGDIEVRSTVGEGTTFAVSLPLEQREPPAEPPVAVLTHRE